MPEKKRKRYGKQDRRGRIPNRISIEQRPAIVTQKSRLGVWEGDTIIGKGHQGVVTAHIERKIKYTVFQIKYQARQSRASKHRTRAGSLSKPDSHHHL